MIGDFLNSQCTGEFAFIAFDNNKVTYAEPLMAGSVWWPAEVVLIQYFAANGVSLYQKTVYIKGKTSSQMGSGMMAHLGIKASYLPVLQKSANAGPFSYTKVTNPAVVSGNANWGVPVDVGEPSGVDLSTQGPYLHRLYLMAALRLIFRFTAKLINISQHHSIKRSAGHNIGALIVKRNGAVIAMGLNSGTLNKTHHAETNAMQTYAAAGKAFPSNAYVYTTLKPCDMCAAMITQLMPSATVIYVQNDPRAVVPTAPTGGMTALQNVVGAKQIRLHDAHLQKTGTDLDLQLNATTTDLQKGTNPNEHFYYLTNVLDDSAIFQLMEDAQHGLQRKANKYVAPDAYGFPAVTPKHPEVREVLEHLARVVGFDMKYADLNWDELRRDFPEHFAMQEE